jgi:glycosyltransferase involved in cell wall biosynthesis
MWNPFSSALSLRWFGGEPKTQPHAPRFLVLLPITRRPHLLEFAVASVLRQSEQDFELHIISDGAPRPTNLKIAALAGHDDRITAHVFPKGERNGEVYRDKIIRDSNARYVCQIGDDDIWFPDHLAQIARLLSECEFGHTIQTETAPAFRLLPLIGDIADMSISRRMMTERFNIFGPTACGYTREAYLKIDKGWEAAPAGIWSDLFMWRKFLAHPDIRCRSRLASTNLHISAFHHTGLTRGERRRVNRSWWDIVSDDARLARLRVFLSSHRAPYRTPAPSPDQWAKFDSSEDDASTPRPGNGSGSNRAPILSGEIPQRQ